MYRPPSGALNLFDGEFHKLINSLINNDYIGIADMTWTMTLGVTTNMKSQINLTYATTVYEIRLMVALENILLVKLQKRESIM